MNRSVIIAAARGTISAKYRQVLTEYGGPIELTNCWAQSFLRRLNFERKGTKTTRKIKETCLCKINEIVSQSNAPYDLIINFDQTNVYIVPVGLTR